MRRTNRLRPGILSTPQTVTREAWPRRLPTVPRGVAGLVARTRRPYLLTFDLVAIALAAYVAIALRFDQITAASALPAFPVVVALLVATQTLTNVRLGLYSRRWGFASVADLVRIVCAVLLGSILSAFVFYSAAYLLNGHWAVGFPRSFWFIEALVVVAILGGVRFAIRAASDLPAAAGVGDDRGPADAAVRGGPDRRHARPLGQAESRRGRPSGWLPRRRPVTARGGRRWAPRVRRTGRAPRRPCADRRARCS